MRFNISDKDKKTLLFLALFLAAAGYYYFLFEPVYTKWKVTDKALRKEKKELAKVGKKIRERASWQADRDNISGRLASVKGRIKMPPAEEGLSERVRAIMKAADKSGVKVSNLRPMARTLDDGITQVVDSFGVDGSADFDGIVGFIDSLWGMKVEEMSLSRTEDPKRPVKFFLKASSLPAWDFELTGLSDNKSVGMRTAGFSLDGNPFSAKRRPLPVVQPKQVRQAAKEEPRTQALSEPAIELTGFRLVGITEVGGRGMAIISDASQKDLFLREGDRAGEYTVASVSEDEVVFENPSGATGSLRLPKKSDGVIEISRRQDRENADEGGEPQRGASLGVGVKAMTPALQKEAGLAVDRGLFVTRVDKAGDIRVGDVITSINTVGVSSVSMASKILGNLEPGEEVELEILRGGASSTIKAATY